MSSWTDRPTLEPGAAPRGNEIEAILDRIEALSGLTVLKTSDESVTSSTTLQDDNELFITVEASTNYLIQGLLFYSADTAGDLKVGFTFPTSATLHWADIGYVSGGSFTIDLTANMSATSGSSSLRHEGGSGTASVTVRGTLLVGATAGTLRLQWAQGASSVVATTIKAGSWLYLVKM